jgi:hypothetical protein
MFVGPKKVAVIQGGDWRLIQVVYSTMCTPPLTNVFSMASDTGGV